MEPRLVGMPQPRGRLQEVQRQAAQQEIEAVALGLFLERGFAATTVDDVALAAGVSRRTVFRYFESKEDLVLASMRATGHRLAHALRELPADQSAWEATTNVLFALAKELDADAAQGRPRGRLLLDTPQLQAALSLKQLEWRALLTDAALPRVTGRPASRRLRAEAQVASALACLDVAATAWTRADQGPTITARLRTAFQALGDQIR
jgi:AcrR family transcriptional regulator